MLQGDVLCHQPRRGGADVGPARRILQLLIPPISCTTWRRSFSTESTWDAQAGEFRHGGGGNELLLLLLLLLRLRDHLGGLLEKLQGLLVLALLLLHHHV